jgi:CLIP-associating protein 1/2
MSSKAEQNPLNPSDASSGGIWHQTKNGGRLLDGLLAYLSPSKVRRRRIDWQSRAHCLYVQPDDGLEYGLIILWELVDRHFNVLEGREADIFSTLLHVRYSNQANVRDPVRGIYGC